VNRFNGWNYARTLLRGPFVFNGFDDVTLTAYKGSISRGLNCIIRVRSHMGQISPTRLYLPKAEQGPDRATPDMHYVHSDDEFGVHMTRQRPATTRFVMMMVAAVVILFDCQNTSHARSRPKAKYTGQVSTMLIHNIQFFLSKTGCDTGNNTYCYTGNIDGMCGPQTKLAINTYIGMLPHKPNGAVCSGPFLNSLMDTILLSHAIHQTDDTVTINLLPSKLDSIKEDILKEINKTHPDIIAPTPKDTVLSSKIDDIIKAIDRTQDLITPIAASLSAVGVVLSVAFSLHIALRQIDKAYKNHKEAISRTTFNYYLSEALKNPIFASPHLFADLYDIPNKKIDKNPITFRQYEWFVSIMIFSMREILDVNKGEKYLEKIVERQLGFHLKYLNWRKPQEPPNFITEAGEPINSMIENLNDMENKKKMAIQRKEEYKEECS
jgi:hypothetical protein